MVIFKKKIAADFPPAFAGSKNNKSTRESTFVDSYQQPRFSTTIDSGSRPSTFNESDSSSSTSIGSVDSGSIARASVRTKVGGKGKKKVAENIKNSCSLIWIKFSCLFFSPIFFRHRTKIFIILEVFIPVIVVLAIIAAFTSGISWKKAYYEKQDSDNSPQPTFPEITMDDAINSFKSKYTNKAEHMLLLFTPYNNLTIAIIDGALRVLGLFMANHPEADDHPERQSSGAVGVSNVLELLERALIHRKEQERHKEPVGVVFHYDDKSLDEKTGLPHLMSFSIRTMDDRIAETSHNFPYVPPLRTDKQSVYVESGFVGLQYAIEQSYLTILLAATIETTTTESLESDLYSEEEEEPETIQNVLENLSIKLRKFYYPNFYNLEIRSLITFTVCCCMVVAYVFSSFFIVRQIVQERQVGIKEVLVMHGLPASVHWLMLLIHALLFRGITAGLVTVILITDFGHGKIIISSDISFIFFIVYEHLLALTFFNFFLASVINSITFVGLYSLLIGIVTFIVPSTFYKFNLLESLGNGLLVALFPNWGLYNIITNIIDFECDDKGVNWKNFFKNGNARDTLFLKISTTMIVMGVSGICYFLLAMYIDLSSQKKLYPPTFRIWDLCTKAVSKYTKQKETKQKSITDEHLTGEKEPEDFEKVNIYEDSDPSQKCYVRIRSLCKRYGKHTMALDTINLNIMHEEITVIQGHGGSGKSTLIKVLAGMIRPTTGYATIKHHDVILEAKKARHFTGFCGHNLIYFNLLTVKQHVFLCYRLRGYEVDDSSRNTSTLLTRLRLWEIRNYYPDSMTVNELRRLNIAMAMTDSPKVILLDAPTSGMDGINRREIWEILKTLKRHHTVIVTSNYMDEAEFLADKVALLAHGRLVCYGSVDYLKNQYDTGYFLTCYPLQNVKLNSNAIMALAKSRMGETAQEMKNRSIKEVDNLVIELPKDFTKLASLCEDLDKNIVSFGIKKYSFKHIGLSDIFIKISESISVEKESADLYVRRDSGNSIRCALASEIPALTESNFSKSKWSQQICSLLKKRILYLKSMGFGIIWKFFVPLCLIFLTLWEARIFIQEPKISPPRNLTFDQFSADLKIFVKITLDSPTHNFSGHISKVLGKKEYKLEKSQTILTSLIEILQSKSKSQGFVKENHIAAIELKKSNPNSQSEMDFVGHFASGALHSDPIILSTIFNILLRVITADEDNLYKLFVINDPLPSSTESLSGAMGECNLICIIFALLLSFTYNFISSSLISFPDEERRSGVKHLQLMSGVHPLVYWAADFIYDVIFMLIITTIVALIFIFHPIMSFDFDTIAVLVVFTALYFAWSGLAFCYYMSTVISMKFRGFSFLILFHVIFCLIPFICLELIWKTSDSFGVVFFRYLFMLLPGYSMSCTILDWFEAISRRSVCSGLLPHIKEMCDINGNHKHSYHSGHFISEEEMFASILQNDVTLGRCCNRMCKKLGACYKQPKLLDPALETFSNPKLITDIVFLVLTGIIYWIFLIISEKHLFSKLSQRVTLKFLESDKGKKIYGKDGYTSKEVKHEMLTVKSVLSGGALPTDIALVIDELTKSHTAKMVINKFSLEVKKGDCIGILGSGKDKLVRIIAGQDLPTKGMCYIGKSSLNTNRREYLSSIGYCPQRNTIFEQFTGIQLLELIGSLRGIESAHLSSQVAKWLQVAGLSEAGKDKCSTYGSGMRRRLCCALAFIGNCPILLLDEPTNGLDPVAREKFWAVIEHLKESGRTIIFTSLHTEECTNVATKIVVLAEGNVQCLGNPTSLKNRFAHGYCLLFRLRHEILKAIDIASATIGKIVELKKAVTATFPQCDLLDEQDNLLLYYVRDPKVKWADIFKQMEELVNGRFSILITSYDISEATIEDLFILLTNKYREMDTPRNMEPLDPLSVPKEDSELKALEKAARALHLKV